MMENKPLITIIMNCYNGELYLTQALESILKQTYSKWELIFWDNHSTDKSAEILNKFNEKRFRYFFSEKHTILHKARNLAIKRAQGEFITFLDTDDWWISNKLELQLELFKNKNINLVYGNCWLVNNNTWIKKKIFSKKKLPTGRVLEEILKNYLIPLPTIMIRKSAFDQSNYFFDERFKIIGDFDICVRLVTIWEFDCVQKPIAFYRIHGKNFLSLNKDIEIKELQIWYDEMKEHPEISKNKELWQVSQKISYLKTLKIVLHGNFFKALSKLIIFPLCLNKFKLLTVLILPKFILKKIKIFGI